jgi:ACS family hexuronate transporter-like MFS transporter
MTKTMIAASQQVGSDSAESGGHLRWIVLGVIFCATTINYMDRFIVGVLKPTIVAELRWSETDYANVIFCFQLAYAIGLVTIGPLLDRIGARRGMMVVVGMCALAAASHSLVATVIGFGIARFALGFGESGTWPGCVKVISEWFPRKERSIGTGVMNAGSSVGATITPFVVPVLLQFVRWPFVFLCTASLDVAWLIGWALWYRAPEHDPKLSPTELAYIRSDPTLPQPKLPWLQLFRHRQTWAFLLGKGLSDPIWWFYLFWVPGFLVSQYHLVGNSAMDSAKALAVPVMVIYLMADVGSVGGGWLSTRLIGRGWSINAARKTVMLGCVVCVLPVVFVNFQIGLWPSVFLIGLAAAAHLGFSANLFTIATDTVPKRAVSSVAGIGGLAAAVGGMVIAKIVGFVLDTTHSYLVPFLLAALAYPVALACVHFLLPKLEPMKLEEPT